MGEVGRWGGGEVGEGYITLKILFKPCTVDSTYFPFERRLNAMAVPMTSCISEPMMAISTMIHKRIRGTVGYLR